MVCASLCGAVRHVAFGPRSALRLMIFSWVSPRAVFPARLCALIAYARASRPCFHCGRSGLMAFIDWEMLGSAIHNIPVNIRTASGFTMLQLVRCP